MNCASELLDAQEPSALALVCRDDRGRTEFTFAEVAALSGALAVELDAAGIGPGDVVLTLFGNRVEWALSMVAVFHAGGVVLPCLEQLRPKDLLQRMEATRPRAVLADPRNRASLDEAIALLPSGRRPIVIEPDLVALQSAVTRGDQAPLPRADAGPEAPALITFTSGTSGPPKAVVHAQRYVTGQRLQATHWFGAQPGRLAWCTAAPGWSKSARNVFIAPWLRGAPALLHDARFDPRERLAVLHEERPHVLCMAPTEYRIMSLLPELALPDSLERLVAAGEALDPAVLAAWHEASGLWVRDGFGQTETGQLTAPPDGTDPLPGSMGRPLPGVALALEFPADMAEDDADEVGAVGELVITDPSTVPTFFLGYLNPESGAPVAHDGPWRTGDRAWQNAAGDLFFVGRTDDVIASSGYRIGPFEVESVLVEHPAVAEAAAVAAPDPDRGSVVRAVVVLRDGFSPSSELATELQAHVRERTAPYKYPRIVDFVEALPKTASGKVRRALLRDGG
ncbi:MAG: AMP-binding protein [Solirubrobacteraceae bacterium]|nr:AMP-binding protein [Solirubrobacteraceae bacterium]